MPAIPYLQAMREKPPFEATGNSTEDLPGKKKNDLIVFAPGMAALAAPEEPDFALIRRPELPEPPECQIVFALWTLYRGGGEGRRGVLLDYHDLPFAATPFDLHLVVIRDLSDIPAPSAFQLATGRDHQALAFRTKHRYNMGIIPD
jgi:hypothetical protein